MGCLGERRLPWWLSEGAAEWVGYDALLLIESPLQMDGGAPKARAAVIAEMVGRARSTGELDYRLEEHGNADPNVGPEVWPGHIGYVAVEQLLDPAEVERIALRTVCEEVGTGRSLPHAFASAFRMALDEFYDQFEGWRQEQLASA